MRIKKNLIRGLVVDQIPNFPNYHHIINWMADSTENYYWDLGTERVKLHGLLCQTATYTFSLKSQLQITFYTKPHPKSVALMFGGYMLLTSGSLTVKMLTHLQREGNIQDHIKFYLIPASY